MNGKWIFTTDFTSITTIISEFECSEVELVIKPIQTRPDFMIYGCYVPSQPRPTSIISGEIFVRKLPDARTELRITDFPSWASPFFEALIKKIRELESGMEPGDGV
jgi:hypothetical protein